jgi:uncharacterized membrane protein
MLALMSLLLGYGGWRLRRRGLFYATPAPGPSPNGPGAAHGSS